MRPKIDLKYPLFLTLVSPLIGASFAITHFDWLKRKWLLIIIVTIFGATIILPEGSDGATLQKMVNDHYVDLSLSQWWYELKEMLIFSPEVGTKGDVFSHMLSYFVGAVLGMPNQYFIFVSFIYAYFYIGALSKILIWHQGSSKSYLFWALIIITVAFRFIDSMQSVRTWTGAWVLFNGVFGYYRTGKKNYLWLMLAAPLFHVAYFLIAIPTYIVVLFRKVSPIFYIAIYFLSFLVSLDQKSMINRLESTELGEKKVKAYYNEDPITPKPTTAQVNWYKEYGKFQSHHLGSNALAFLLIFSGLFNKRKMTSLEAGLFSTGLLLASMANFGDFILPFYRRTMSNAGLYIIVTTILLLLRGELLKNNQLLFKKISLWIVVAIFTPYLVYTLANIIQFTSLYMVSLPILTLIDGANISIRGFIDYIMPN